MYSKFQYKHCDDKVMFVVASQYEASYVYNLFRKLQQISLRDFLIDLLERLLKIKISNVKYN